MNRHLLKSGFALPTVLIVSVIVMITATAILQGSLSSKVALENQYYESIAREAADAGLARARSCFNQQVRTWTTLTPNNTCSGQALPSPDYVFKNDKIQSTFEVSAPIEASGGTWRAKSTGTVSLIRKDGSKLVLASQAISQVINPNDQFSNTSANSLSKISAGNGVTCAAYDGSAYCWGNNTYGQVGDGTTTTPRGLPTKVVDSGVLGGKIVNSVAAGDVHSCALASGQVYCWGYNAEGELGNNSTSNSSVPVAVNTSGVLSGKTVTEVGSGSRFSCALASGQVYCWGANNYGQLGNNSTSNSSVPVAVNTSGVLSGKTVTKLAVGLFHACAIANNQAYCWGANEFGRLGNNSTTNSSIPVAVYTAGVLSGKTVTSLSGGNAQTCAVANGAAYCWGYGVNGQLGNNSTTSSSVPVAVYTGGVLSSQTIIEVTAQNASSCARTANDAYCWGSNQYGQLGNNSTTQSNVPVAVQMNGKKVDALEAGEFSICALSGGQGFCWGAGDSGRLGNNSTANSLIPTVVLFPFPTSNDWSGVSDSVTQVAGGYYHTCAVARGKAYCWGDNTYGQLGDGTTTARTSPVAVSTTGALGGKVVTALSSSYYHTCAIADGKAYCWGLNNLGQLGNNSTTNSSVPVEVISSGVLAGKTVTAIGAGTGHTCAIASGQVYCWGHNGYGNLGNNSTTQSNVPVATYTGGVLSGKTISSIAVGYYHTCVAANGQAYCWGYNSDGQIGDNTTANKTVPTAVYSSGVLSGKYVSQVSGGYIHSCAIANGWPYCWGFGVNAPSVGQLGNGSTTTGSLVPVTVNGGVGINGKTVTSIASSPYHNCVLADNKMSCWGANSSGQLGTSNNLTYTSPVLISATGAIGDKPILSIGVGLYHTCGIAQKKLSCWGHNVYGQIGDTTNTNRNISTAVYSSSTVAPIIIY